MPFVHGKSTAVFLGGTDVSSFLNSVDQTISRDVSETSVFGAQAKSYLKGHKDGTISLSGYWDGAANAIDAVMANALGNTMNGYAPSVLAVGETLASYVNVNVTADTTTPIAGYSESIQFGDSTVVRLAAKGTSRVVGTRYLVTMLIRMDDSSAPVLSGTPDFKAVWEGSYFDFQTSELISGNIYRVSAVFNATSALSNTTGIVKAVGTTSAKGFRAIALTSQPAASVAMTRTVDTYGPELLAAGEDISAYGVAGGVTQALTPIAGFDKSLQWISGVDNRAYKFFTPTLGATYRFSAVVQMDDGSVPTPGSNSASADFAFFTNTQTIFFPPGTIENIGGAVYRLSVNRYTTSTNNVYGIYKYASNSSKTFRAGGYSLRQLTPVTVPTAPALSICEAGASTVGNRCLVVQAHDTSYQVTSPTTDTVAVSAEFQVDGSFGSGAFRGVVLAANTTYPSGTNTASVDNGATTFGGLVANFHTLDNSGFVTMKIQHSTDNSTWVDLLTSTSFVQSGFEHLTTPNVVYRYLRVNVTSSGTPRIVVTAARK